MNAPSRPAAIMGQLVDAKNVAQHKCLRLTIDVPAEQAMHVIETLGWPTQVSPVPVAVARLMSQTDAPVARPRKPVAADKRLAQQCGIACNEPAFWRFLEETQGCGRLIDSVGAAEVVRDICKVGSRAEIVHGTAAGDTWDALYSRFVAWEHM